jgi:Nif-specific regulatory protein
VLAAGTTIGYKDLGLDRQRSTGAASDSQLGMSAMTSSAAIPVPPVETPDGVHIPPGLTLEEAERRYAKAVLDREGGNQSAAARALGISRNKLARLLKS